MFFYEKKLVEAIDNLKLNDSNHRYHNFYNDLKDKKYTIVFHFSADNDALFYEAFKKDEFNLSTNIDYAYLKISFLENKINDYLEGEDDINECLVLAWYIFNIDKEKIASDSHYIDKKYHFVPENLRHIDEMEPKARDLFLEARDKFLNLLNVIDKIDTTNDSENTFENELSKVKIINKSKLFDKDDNGYYRFKPEKQYYDLPDHLVELHDRQMFDEILAIRGNKILIKDNEYKILSEIQEGSVNIDEFNKVVFTPSLRFVDQKRFFYDNKKTFIEINILRKQIRIIRFTTRTSALFYKYFIENPIIKIDYIKDILEAKLGDDITKILRPKKTQDIEAHYLYIDYNVTLKITNALEFETVFRLNHKNYARDELIKNYYYRDIIYKFEAILKQLNLPENSTHTNINVLDFLTLDLSKLREIANVNLDDSIQSKRIITDPQLEFIARKNNDWFELDIISKTYTEEQVQKIFSSLKEKRNYVVVNEDVIDLNHLENKKDLLEVYEFKNRFAHHFPMYELFKLESIKQHSSIDISYDDYVKKVLYEIKNYKNIDVNIPKHIVEKLRSYQIEAVKWMYVLSKNGLAGVLADDMGLGKTLETIAYLETIKENEPALIVCPKSVTFNWLYEFEKWNSTYKCKVIEGNKDYRDSIIASITNGKIVYIISYDTLRNDIDQLSKTNFSTIILDEAQYIKNADALKSKAVKKINSKYKFALTGTPIENGLSDLWSIFDFIMPGYLYDYQTFKLEYADAFENDKNEEAKERLIAKITPFVFKRTKSQVLKELPGKTTTTVTIAMTDAQQDIYSTYLRKTKLMLRNHTSTNQFRMLQAILRLRQICVDPSAFLLNYEEVPAKISFALDMIQEVLKNKSKVVVYSSFVSVLETMKKNLKKAGIEYYSITGSTSAHDRVALSNKFNTTDEVSVMLVSIKAGGTGLNLIGAESVIILDPWWNAAVEEQAADRAYRIGQTKPVTVYKLIAHNSIEEKILKLQYKKQALYEKLIKGDTEGISGLTEEDIQYIFS